jgi:hypothetical protein
VEESPALDRTGCSWSEAIRQLRSFDRKPVRVFITEAEGAAAQVACLMGVLQIPNPNTGESGFTL